MTKDFINPQHPWPNIDALATMVRNAGFELGERLTVYPKFNTGQFLSPTISAHISKGANKLYPTDKQRNWNQHERPKYGLYIH